MFNKRKIKKKGQTSIEFLILLGLMLIVFNAFLLLVFNSIKLIHLNNSNNNLLSLSDHLYLELTTAYQVNDGYKRYFSLPKKLNNDKYSVVITSKDEITITSSNNQFIIFLPFNLSNEKNYELGILNRIEKKNGNINITCIKSFD